MENDPQNLFSSQQSENEKRDSAIRAKAPEFWAQIRKAVKDIVADTAPFKKFGAHEFQSRFVAPNYFEVWMRTQRPIPGFVCDFKNPVWWQNEITVRGYEGYDPPEVCYSVFADREGANFEVFLRGRKNPERKLTPTQVANEIVSAFQKKYGDRELSS